MVAQFWIDEVEELRFDGDDAVFTLKSAGETLVLRGKRHVALEGLVRCQKRYAEMEAAERKARVVSIRCRQAAGACCKDGGG
jgi:hypothetical protein